MPLLLVMVSTISLGNGGQVALSLIVHRWNKCTYPGRSNAYFNSSFSSHGIYHNLSKVIKPPYEDRCLSLGWGGVKRIKRLQLESGLAASSSELQALASLSKFIKGSTCRLSRAEMAMCTAAVSFSCNLCSNLLINPQQQLEIQQK